MFESHDHAILEICRENKFADAGTLRDLESECKATGKSLASVLVDNGVVEKKQLLAAVARHLGLQYFEGQIPDIAGDIINAIPGHIARDYGVIPTRVDAGDIDLLTADPFNNQIVDDLTFALGKDVFMVVADPERVEALVQLHYGDDEATVDDLLKELSSNDHDGVLSNRELTEEDITAMAGQTPIVRFVNLVLGQAIRDKASDIHFEPFEHEFKIRYRIDGALYEMAPPPKHLALPITSRIKVLANLNIAERRVPQDGRIKITVGGHAVDLRVSTLPTQFGESVVLRVLDQSAVQLDITSLGMPDDVFSGINEIIRRPNGIFIVTGPTGSGKTTTLYSALRVVNTIDSKLLTAEDPVEYEIEGIMQV
ncbi:MAG: Flp pilus assembly complex ATPase component TadA, partial [Opitutaceae bacterium]|nr:Flp pilus assembly complex ATPase component TadA [Opitutaceae bacterium]